jgi:hypothetical protein
MAYQKQRGLFTASRIRRGAEYDFFGPFTSSDIRDTSVMASLLEDLSLPDYSFPFFVTKPEQDRGNVTSVSSS